MAQGGLVAPGVGRGEGMQWDILCGFARPKSWAWMSHAWVLRMIERKIPLIHPPPLKGWHSPDVATPVMSVCPGSGSFQGTPFPPWEPRVSECLHFPTSEPPLPALLQPCTGVCHRSAVGRGDRPGAMGTPCQLGMPIHTQVLSSAGLCLFQPWQLSSPSLSQL